MSRASLVLLVLHVVGVAVLDTHNLAAVCTSVLIFGIMCVLSMASKVA